MTERNAGRAAAAVGRVRAIVPTADDDDDDDDATAVERAGSAQRRVLLASASICDQARGER